MSACRFTAWAVLAVFCAFAVAQDESEISVSSNGLRVIAEDIAPDRALRPFNGDPGTSISLILTSLKGGLVQIDTKNSAISKFIDDKGTDLLTRKDPGLMAPLGFSMYRVSKDGKHAAMELNGPNAPAKGSAKLTIEGLLTVLCAKQTTEHIQRDVAIKNGSKITGPNLELTIDMVGKPDIGSEPVGLLIRAYKELDQVAEIRFFKADGTEIRSVRMGTAKMGILGNLTVEWNYNLAEKADTATVKLLLWSDLQKKRVPFKLDIDVGL